VALQQAELADGNREAADGETEYDDSHAGPNPGKERAFVGEVIAGSVGVVSHAGGNAG
jgi:hypothetical protein